MQNKAINKDIIEEATRYLARLGGHFAYVPLSELVSERHDEVSGTRFTVSEIKAAFDMAAQSGDVYEDTDADGDLMYILPN